MKHLNSVILSILFSVPCSVTLLAESQGDRKDYKAISAEQKAEIKAQRQILHEKRQEHRKMKEERKAQRVERREERKSDRVERREERKDHRVERREERQSDRVERREERKAKHK